MPSWSDLFAQRDGLLVNGWTASHDYSADLVAAYPPWGSGAGGDVIQFLRPTGFSDIFAAEVTGGSTDLVEPDWSSAPNVGDFVADGGTAGGWCNCGPLTGFPVIDTWQPDHDYTTVPNVICAQAVTPITPNDHCYVAYPLTGFSVSNSSEPVFPTDGSFIADGGSLFWLDMGVVFGVSARVSVAFTAGPLDAFPEWTSLDATDNLITGHTISRGRTDTFDRTGTGTASIGFADHQGILDPTNPSGPYYNSGNFIDGKQAAIALQNPCTGEWFTIFRGHVDDVAQTVDLSQVASFGSIELVDGLDYMAGFQLRPGVDGDGDPVHAGDVYYGPTTITSVDFRINQVLTDIDWPVELRDVFTGNVRVQGHTYAPGTPALNVIDDACDAEFPGIANRFITKEGIFAFRGRFARFRGLEDPEFDVRQWYAGDGAAIEGNSRYAQIRSLSFGRPRNAIINDTLFTPQGVADADIATGRDEDLTSIDDYGRHNKSAQDLLILEDIPTGNNAIDECHEFASYWVAARKDPKTRVTEISFKSLHPDDPRAARTWALMCEIDINDAVYLKANTPAGGFDDEIHFVEGIRYDIEPLNPEFDNVTLTVSLTPASDFNYGPWSEA